LRHCSLASTGLALRNDLAHLVIGDLVDYDTLRSFRWRRDLARRSGVCFERFVLLGPC
jgi:hypothetical protein